MGLLDGIGLGDSLQLMALDDTFAGGELDCDRWGVALDIPGEDPAVILGAEIRQYAGVHFRLPARSAFSRALRHQLLDVASSVAMTPILRVPTSVVKKPCSLRGDGSRRHS